MTFTINKPIIKHPNLSLPKFVPSKKFWLIAAGTVVVLALLVFGIVKSVQASRAQAETDRVKAAQTAQLEKQRQAQLTTATAQLTAETARTQTVCHYVQQLKANRTITRYVTVPAACL